LTKQQISGLEKVGYRPIVLKKLGKVNLWMKNLTSSPDQNRRYQTISNRLDVWNAPKSLPFDFFNTIGQN
jgi:hypothetical protein